MKTGTKDAASSLPKVPVARLSGGHEGPIQVVRFSASGKYCLTGGQDRTVRLWNPLRIDPAFPLPPKFIPRRRGAIGPVEPDDVALDRIARALPIQTYTNGYTHPISALSLDPSSTTLVAASSKALVITDVVTQQVKRRFQGHIAPINAVAISGGCETYLSASYDATVKIWDGRSNSIEPIMTLKEAKDSVTDIHVVQDEPWDSGGKRREDAKKALIRTASVDGVVRTYDVRMGKLSADDCHCAITSMAPTHDGNCLVINCLDGTIRLMELDSGELLNTYSGRHVAGQYGLHCCMTSDDAAIVTGSEDGKAVIYDIVTATAVQTLEGHTRATCAVAAHPRRDHSSVLITASYDGTAVVWANHEGFMKWQD